MLNRRMMIASTSAGIFGTMLGRASAQSWPSRPVSIIVPFPPGGSTDIIARLLGEKLRAATGGTFIIENKAGATGNIGVAAAARATPDGHTLLISTSGPVATNTITFKNLPTNPLTELTPIALLAEIPGIIAVKNDLPVKNLKELLDYDQANPGKLTFGHPGLGSMGNMAAEMLAIRTNRKFSYVPYQGSGPMVRDLAGGVLDGVFDLAPSCLPLIQGGQIRGIAAMSTYRLSELPNLPTVIEQGFPDFDGSSFVALLGPAGLPADIVQKLNAVVNDWIRSDEGKKVISTQMMHPIGGTPDDLRVSTQKTIARWAPVVKAAGISLGN
jgi:tripartite-type tricarboxylate transporter receptor subunit TctC